MADTEKTAAPEVDSNGIRVGGNIKAVYEIVAMGKGVQPDGAIIVQAKTACDRIVSVMKQENVELGIVGYAVHISAPGSTDTERQYSGEEGSDACRVFNSYHSHWEKCEEVPNATQS